MKRLTLRGSTLRSRTPEYQHKLLGDFEKTALPLILKGEMEVKVHEVSAQLRPCMTIPETRLTQVAGLPLDESRRCAQGDGGQQE